MSAYRDGETTSVPRNEIVGHLVECADCRGTVESMSRLTGSLATTPAIGCAAARPLISAQLDGEASPAEAAMAAAHLGDCADCRAARARWMTVDLAIVRLPLRAPSPAADRRIRDLVRPRERVHSGPRFGGGVLVPVAVAAVAFALAFLSSLPAQQGAPSEIARPSDVAAPNLVAALEPRVALNARTNVLYVLEPARGVLVARDAVTSDLLSEVSIGGSPSALAVNDATNSVYVLDATAKTVTEVSGSTNTVVNRVDVPVTGTPTTLEVNAQSGKVVVASSATTPSAGSASQLTVIDVKSSKVESVRTVEVASVTQIEVNSRTNRAYLLGSTETRVVDATTFAPIEKLPAYVSVAAGQQSSPDAFLADTATGARVTFAASSARADIPGRAVTLRSLPDGTFAALTDVNGNGRISLVKWNGEIIGSLAVQGTARQLTFDADTQRFLGANGQVVASIARGAVVAVTPSPSPSPTAQPSATPSPSPSPTSTPAPQPAAVLPRLVPTAVAPIPGATVAADGIYRLALGAHQVRALGTGDRIWFVDQGGELLAVDPSSGNVTILTSLGRDLTDGFVLASARTVYVIDVKESVVVTVDIATGRQVPYDVPVRGSLSAASLAGDHLWLAESGAGSLLDFDIRSHKFTLVPLTGVSVGAVEADLSGRVWVADSLRSAFYSYEPTLRRLTEFISPVSTPIRSIAADDTGQIWLATASGQLFVLNAGQASPVRTVSGGVAMLAAGSDVTYFLTGGINTAIGLTANGTAVAGPANAKLITVDGRGRAWVSGPTLDAFFIVDMR